MPRSMPVLALSALLATNMGCAFFISYPDTSLHTQAEAAAVTRPLDAQGVARWREAGQRILRTLQKKHPNPWFRLPEAEFCRQVADLDRDLSGLTERQVVLRWKLICAAMGDEHTSLWEQDTGTERWPVCVKACPAGVFITEAMPNCKDLLGAQVLTVGGQSVEAFLQSLEAFGAAAVPSFARMRAADRFPFGWLWLKELGRLPSGSTPTIDVTWPDGRQETRILTPVTNFGRLPWSRLPPAVGLLRASDPDQLYTFRLIEENRTLYIRYRRCQNQKGGESVWSFTGRVEKAAAAAQPRRVIVDLRGNGGGNSVLLWRMIHWIHRTPAFSKPGGLLVLTDAETFSSAFINARELQQTGGLVIGSEPGQPVNAYGDIRFTKLPGLRPAFGCSTKAFIYDPGDVAAWHHSLRVDVPVAETREDILGLTDSTLAAALHTPLPEKGADNASPF